MNIGGKKKDETDYLDGHHLNHDTLDNRIINILPVWPQQHRYFHPNDWVKEPGEI